MSSICFLHSFYDTFRRRTYLTASSYLELIRAFKDLLGRKRNQLLTLKNRYVVGLEKIDFSEKQVGVMQIELQDLQPILIKVC